MISDLVNQIIIAINKRPDTFSVSTTIYNENVVWLIEDTETGFSFYRGYDHSKKFVAEYVKYDRPVKFTKDEQERIFIESKSLIDRYNRQQKENAERRIKEREENWYKLYANTIYTNFPQGLGPLAQLVRAGDS